MGFDKFGSGETFESCDKFGSGGVLFASCTPKNDEPVSMEEAVQKARKAILETFQPVIEECARIVQSVMDVIVPCIQQAIDALNHIWNLIIESYPDKRIVWLALHHKKERIRKKNRNRIVKWIERIGKSGNQKNRGHSVLD